MIVDEDKRSHVVVTDDNPVNLDLAEEILKDDYKVTKLISGGQLLRFLQRVHPDLILLDIQMPGLDGYQVLEEIRKNPAYDDIPVIILTGQNDSASQQRGFNLGAQDFIIKPFNNDVAMARIHSQIELYHYRNGLEEIIREKTRRIEDLQHVIITSWAEIVESRDGTTGSHVRNTTRYYESLLQVLAQSPAYAQDFPEDLRSDYIRASIVHDIGKIGISDEVLKKPGPLTEAEFCCMQGHCQIGADMIQKIIDSTNMGGFLIYGREMALSHHERWDGTGYPRGLKGEEIPVYVRALSIADVYDALTSVRPYKIAFTHEQAVSMMAEERGRFFSPDLFDLFLEHSEVIHELLLTKSD